MLEFFTGVGDFLIQQAEKLLVLRFARRLPRAVPLIQPFLQFLILLRPHPDGFAEQCEQAAQPRLAPVRAALVK